MIALRYRFLDELYYAREQAANLADLIDGYYATCMTPSPQRRRQERAISGLFTLLLEHIADTPNQANFLLDEAKFQERRLHLR